MMVVIWMVVEQQVYMEMPNVGYEVTNGVGKLVKELHDGMLELVSVILLCTWGAHKTNFRSKLRFCPNWLDPPSPPGTLGFPKRKKNNVYSTF